VDEHPLCYAAGGQQCLRVGLVCDLGRRPASRARSYPRLCFVGAGGQTQLFDRDPATAIVFCRDTVRLHRDDCDNARCRVDLGTGLDTQPYHDPNGGPCPALGRDVVAVQHLRQYDPLEHAGSPSSSHQLGCASDYAADRARRAGPNLDDGHLFDVFGPGGDCL
jgi:hypothetical protein